MIFSTPIPFIEALDSQRVKAALMPTSASSYQLQAVAPEILERSTFAARVTNAQFLQSIHEQMSSLVAAETDPATVRLRLKQTLESIGYMPDPDKRGGIEDLSSDPRLHLIIDTQEKMSHGYGNWQQGQDQSVLDAWPAQELYRAEARNQERAWNKRWTDAGGTLYEGRMIAKKNSPIWTVISAFSLPYPPFDYNSGMDVRDIARDEALRLGVINERTDPVRPQTRGFNDTLQASGKDLAPALQRALLDSLGDYAKIDDAGILHLHTEPILENARRGKIAMQQVLATHTDVLEAMSRPEFGPIDFRWGDESGGVLHLLKRREAQRARFPDSLTGEGIAAMMPEVIAKGVAEHVKERKATISYLGFKAVLGKDLHGTPVDRWLLDGFDIDAAKGRGKRSR